MAITKRCRKAEQGFCTCACSPNLKTRAPSATYLVLSFAGVVATLISYCLSPVQQTFEMDVPAAMPRTLKAAKRVTSGALAASRHVPNAGGITLPMAIWSRRQFSSGQALSLPPPLTSLGGSSGGAHGAPSYFQRSQRLPTNTIVKFVPQQQAWVVERFGRFSRILEPGLAILIPAIDVRNRTSSALRAQS